MLKKEVAGLRKDLRNVEEASVATLKLKHQKELQDEQYKSKMATIELNVLKKVCDNLHSKLRFAEGEASKIRTQMDQYMFGGAKSDQALSAIRSKQTLK